MRDKSSTPFRSSPIYVSCVLTSWTRYCSSAVTASKPLMTCCSWAWARCSRCASRWCNGCWRWRWSATAASLLAGKAVAFVSAGPVLPVTADDGGLCGDLSSFGLVVVRLWSITNTNPTTITVQIFVFSLTIHRRVIQKFVPEIFN